MTRSMLCIRAFLLIARLSFGALLVWAAFGKLLDPERFAQQVAKYDIVGPNASAVVGTVLPWAEFLVGSCLLTNIWNVGTWLMTTALFGCFIAARASVLHRGLSLECGCGVLEAKITPGSVVTAAGLFIASALAYVATIAMARASGKQNHSPRLDTFVSSNAQNNQMDAEVPTCV